MELRASRREPSEAYAYSRQSGPPHLHAELLAGLLDGGLDAPEVLVVDAGEEVVLLCGECLDHITGEKRDE